MEECSFMSYSSDFYGTSKFFSKVVVLPVFKLKIPLVRLKAILENALFYFSLIFQLQKNNTDIFLLQDPEKLQQVSFLFLT